MKITLNDTLKNKQMSQYKLAKETGIAASTINNLCNQKTSSIQFDVLQKICNTLDCNVEDIIQKEEPIDLVSYSDNKGDTIK